MSLTYQDVVNADISQKLFSNPQPTMNQIPNVEETHTTEVEEIVKEKFNQLKISSDNHLAINAPEQIAYCDALDDALPVVVKLLHHQLQKALEIQAIEIREEEANEYNKIIEQELQKERERCITKAWSYIVDATHAESWSRDELRKAVQSELDQPDALTK